MIQINLEETDVITELERNTPPETFVQIVVFYDLLPDEMKQSTTKERYEKYIQYKNIQENKVYLTYMDYGWLGLYDIETNKSITIEDGEDGDYYPLFVKHLKCVGIKDEH